MPPFLASSCDVQMHVAKLRPSASGVPNQYLQGYVSNMLILLASASDGI